MSMTKTVKVTYNPLGGVPTLTYEGKTVTGIAFVTPQGLNAQPKWTIYVDIKGASVQLLDTREQGWSDLSDMVHELMQRKVISPYAQTIILRTGRKTVAKAKVQNKVITQWEFTPEVSIYTN